MEKRRKDDLLPCRPYHTSSCDIKKFGSIRYALAKACDIKQFGSIRYALAKATSSGTDQCVAPGLHLYIGELPGSIENGAVIRGGGRKILACCHRKPMEREFGVEQDGV